MNEDKAPEAQVVQRQETVEVVGIDGKTQQTGNSALAGIFDKIESAKAEGRDVKEAISTAIEQKPEKEEPKEQKKEEPKPEVENKQEEVKPEAKDEDPREFLKKAFEKKDADKKQKAEDKERAKQEDKADDVTEDDLKVLPHDKPKTAKRIDALLGRIKKAEGEVANTKKEAQEKAEKLAELEKKLAEVKPVDPLTDERVKSQLDELAMFRRRYELDSDPEVKTKFDARVEGSEKAIFDTLKKNQAGEGLLKIIQEEGGWGKFSGSNRQLKFPDGNGGEVAITANEVADLILKKLPLADRKSVESSMMEQIQLQRDKDRFLKEQQETAKEYFKKKEAEKETQTKAQKEQIEAAKKVIEDWNKSIEGQEWLKDKDVAATLSQEEKAEIESFNTYNKQLKAYIKKAVATDDLNGMLGIIEDAAKYHHERRNLSSVQKENDRLKAELEAKQNEIAKFKKGSRSVPVSGSISVAASPEARETTPLTLEEQFEQIARRKAS